MTSSASLLLVDDDPLSLELLQGYLTPAGYRLTLARDGEEAWRLLGEPGREFDLVVSDRSMPRLNGMDLLRRIQAEPRLADTPVIFETALSDQSDIAEGIAAGVHYYLTKPFNYRLLLAVVKAALDDRAERKAQALAARRSAGALSFLQTAQFSIRAPDEAHELALLLAGLTPNPDASVLGFSELLFNAIEHGNLDIGYREKSELLVEGAFHHEVKRRLNELPWQSRTVDVTLERGVDALVVRIGDQGEGFDPSAYLDLDPARMLDPNGRGIAMARQISFSHLEYLGKGNVVVATVAL
jgi:DNA-binding response OmpR family regulator